MSTVFRTLLGALLLGSLLPLGRYIGLPIAERIAGLTPSESWLGKAACGCLGLVMIFGAAVVVAAFSALSRMIGEAICYILMG